MDVYLDPSAAPLDEYSVPDVGDQGIKRSKAKIARALASVKPPGALIVPFARTIKLWSVGKDVIGAKRAVWAANGLPVPVGATRIAGPIFVRQLKIFQRKHGLVADGQIGPATLKKLAPYFDRYAFLLYTGYPPGGNPELRKRNAAVAYALWGYNNRVQIGYLERRLMQHMNELELLPVEEDCSEFATKDAKFSGSHDPNGQNYNGVGNTSYMRAHSQRISLAEAKPGDLIHYDGPQHVAVYIGNGRVISHGSEIGPLLLLANYRPIVMVTRHIF